MLLIRLQTQDEQKHVLFAQKSARAWQQYFDLTGLLPDITLTSEQKAIVQQNEKQLFIQGSAGSGKSLMLVYRLLRFLEQTDGGKRILYVSFNETLIQDAKKRLNLSPKYHELKEKHQIDIMTYHQMARNLLKQCGYPNLRSIRMTTNGISNHEGSMYVKVTAVLSQFTKSSDAAQFEKLYQTHTVGFLLEEFLWMKANGLITLDKYLETERTGRGNSPKVEKKQKSTIFHLFSLYNEFLQKNNRYREYDMEDYALLLLNEVQGLPESTYYDYVFVDEVQDLQPMQIKSLVQLTNGNLTIAGDAKQRIYKRTPFSYKALGIELRGRRNQKLNQNFRSTKQIMRLASNLSFLDVENDREDDQIFVREGPRPQIRHFKDDRKQTQYIIRKIKEIFSIDRSSTIAIIHRYPERDLKIIDKVPIKAMLEREFDLITTESYGRRFDYESVRKPVFFTDPFSIKGLEFDYVFVIQFDRHHYPSAERITRLKEKYEKDELNNEAYEKDYESIFNDEKKLLYVACTRAKKELYITYKGTRFITVSQFIRDFNTRDYEANFNKSTYKE